MMRNSPHTLHYHRHTLQSELYITLVKYLVNKILDKIQGTEMLVDLENLGTR